MQSLGQKLTSRDLAWVSVTVTMPLLCGAVGESGCRDLLSFSVAFCAGEGLVLHDGVSVSLERRSGRVEVQGWVGKIQSSTVPRLSRALQLAAACCPWPAEASRHRGGGAQRFALNADQMSGLAHMTCRSPCVGFPRQM